MKTTLHSESRSFLLALCAASGIACSPVPTASDGGGSDAACPADTPETCPSTVPSYATEIAPLVEAKCVVCHQAGGPGAAWPLGSWPEIHNQELEVQSQIASCKMPLPDGGQLLTDTERVVLLTWLVCGAPEN